MTELPNGDRLMTQALPDIKVSFPADQSALLLVLVQLVPQSIQPLETPRDLEPPLDCCRLAPGLLRLFTPCAAEHDTSETLIELLVIPEERKEKLKLRNHCEKCDCNLKSKGY